VEKSWKNGPSSSKLWHDASRQYQEAIKDARISTNFTFSTFFTYTRHCLSVDLPFLHNRFLEGCQQYCTPIYQYAARPSANRGQIGHQHLALRRGDSRRLHCWRSVVSGRSSSGSSQEPPSAYALAHALCGNRGLTVPQSTRSRGRNPVTHCALFVMWFKTKEVRKPCIEDYGLICLGTR
jgi:hypothetical protein